jgi:hypothetical protein
MGDAHEEEAEDPVLIYSDVLEKVGCVLKKNCPHVPEARPDASLKYITQVF